MDRMHYSEQAKKNYPYYNQGFSPYVAIAMEQHTTVS